MVHTHTHTPRSSGADEMKMTMKWQLLNQDAKRGTQKKRDRENTNTTHLAQSGQTLKGQGKRKAEADGHGTRPADGGEDGSAWTNLTQRKPTPTSAREGPNLPVERRRRHMKKGTHGGLVNEMMHPQIVQVPLFRHNGLLVESTP